MSQETHISVNKQFSTNLIVLGRIIIFLSQYHYTTRVFSYADGLFQEGSPALRDLASMIQNWLGDNRLQLVNTAESMQ